MNAKETQQVFIKTYLKPTLKEHGYLTAGQTWWRDCNNFFIIINLQNFSWNTKEDVTFCFNIGIGLKATLKNPLKPAYADFTVMTRSNGYLPNERFIHRYKDNKGYILKNDTNLPDFTDELKCDFEQHILPRLEQLKTLNDCIDYFKPIPFWSDRLTTIITDLGLAT